MESGGRSSLGMRRSRATWTRYAASLLALGVLERLRPDLQLALPKLDPDLVRVLGQVVVPSLRSNPLVNYHTRPPITVEAAPLSGAASPSPATVQRRPLVAPLLWTRRLEGPGYPPDHPYVRRYWTAVLGPGAVADLLRLMTAARRGCSLLEPLHLSTLARAGLVRFEPGRVWVRGDRPAAFSPAPPATSTGGPGRTPADDRAC
jgi:hypothetical protein